MFDTLVWGIGVTLIILALMWLVDRLHPIDFRREIERGNVAAAVYFAAIALIIGATMIAMAIA
jgi:uncharacterized membrane protein YjfL (UPF0719 family)